MYTPTPTQVHTHTHTHVINAQAEGKQYTIRPGDAGSGCMLVSDLTSRAIVCNADVEALMALADKNKTVKGTDMNERYVYMCIVVCVCVCVVTYTPSRSYGAG